MIKSIEKYWYYMERHACVLCGREKTYRERRYTPRPEQWEDRNPKAVWSSAKLDICPEIRDYANIMLIKTVAQQ